MNKEELNLCAMCGMNPKQAKEISDKITELQAENVEHINIHKVWSNNVRLLEKEIDRLKSVERDHLIDWNRIQDAERKCEAQSVVIDKITELYKELCHEANVNHGFWLKKFKDNVAKLKGDL